MTATVRSSATGAPAYSDTFLSAPESAGKARRFVTMALNTWQLDPLTHDAELIVSEFVSNAVEHTRSRALRVTITRTADRAVRIGVIDKDRSQPQLRAAGPDDEEGRGLALVDALSDRWGVDLLGWGGKRAWADLEDL